MITTPFLSELREAQMFFNGKDLKGRSAEEIGELVFLLLLLLEIIRYEYPSKAKSYASETARFNPFTSMQYSATDLANLLAVLSNQDTYEDKIKKNKNINIPTFAINRFLSDVQSGKINHHDDATFFYRCEDFLKLYTQSTFRQFRRDIGNWGQLNSSEKKQYILAIRREFDKRASNADLYLWFKSSFRLNEDVTIPSHKTAYEYHSELNPALWNGAELKIEVKQALDKIAEHFIEFLDVEQLKVVDVIITGSNCAFNYTNESDVDLHVLVNPSKLGKNPLTQPFLIAKKSLWNSGHDITVKGFDVELYAEDVTDENNKLVATGIYSLWQDKWIKEPKREEITVDDQAVQSKAIDIKAQIDQLIDSNSDDLDAVNKIWDHIKKMRKAGLASIGEWSVENLAFKVLRNDGYLDKLATYETDIFDRSLTLEQLNTAQI